MTTGPIFIRGLSRSGGTLIVTLLDAHPDVAMSYELYPRLLDCGAEGDSVVATVLDQIERRGALDKHVECPKDLRVFINRCARGGIVATDFVRLAREHRAAGHSFAEQAGRYRFVETCCVHKQRAEGKKRWGLKCNNAYDEYLHYWPDAFFVDVVRDPRDVVASQQVTGSFNKAIDDATGGWVRTHQQFLELQRGLPEQAYLLVYETMVTDPAAETARLCAFLGLAFEPAMLDYHKRDLTIYRASHLSMERISKPIDASQVGRWRQVLGPTEVARVNELAGALMREFGYVGESHADGPDRDPDHPERTPEERSRPAAVTSTLRAYLGRFFRPG